MYSDSLQQQDKDNFAASQRFLCAGWDQEASDTDQLTQLLSTGGGASVKGATAICFL